MNFDDLKEEHILASVILVAYYFNKENNFCPILKIGDDNKSISFSGEKEKMIFSINGTNINSVNNIIEKFVEKTNSDIDLNCLKSDKEFFKKFIDDLEDCEFINEISKELLKKGLKNIVNDEEKIKDLLNTTLGGDSIKNFFEKEIKTINFRTSENIPIEDIKKIKNIFFFDNIENITTTGKCKITYNDDDNDDDDNNDIIAKIDENCKINNSKSTAKKSKKSSEERQKTLKNAIDNIEIESIEIKDEEIEIKFNEDIADKQNIEKFLYNAFNEATESTFHKYIKTNNSGIKSKRTDKEKACIFKKGFKDSFSKKVKECLTSEEKILELYKNNYSSFIRKIKSYIKEKFNKKSRISDTVKLFNKEYNTKQIEEKLNPKNIAMINNFWEENEILKKIKEDNDLKSKVIKNLKDRRKNFKDIQKKSAISPEETQTIISAVLDVKLQDLLCEDYLQKIANKKAEIKGKLKSEITSTEKKKLNTNLRKIDQVINILSLYGIDELKPDPTQKGQNPEANSEQQASQEDQSSKANSEQQANQDQEQSDANSTPVKKDGSSSAKPNEKEKKGFLERHLRLRSSSAKPNKKEKKKSSKRFFNRKGK